MDTRTPCAPDRRGPIHHCRIHGVSRVRNLRTATPAPASRPPALLESARSGRLESESAFFSSIRSIPACSQRRRAGACGRSQSQQSVGLHHPRHFGFSLLPIPAVPEGLFRLAPIGLLLGWYFGLGKRQIRYVKETWRDRYKRKPWNKPLLIAFSILIGTFIVLTVADKLVSGLH